MSTADKEPPFLIPMDEVSRLLGGLGRGTLYKLIHEQRLNPVKIGRRTMFVRQEVLMFATGGS